VVICVGLKKQPLNANTFLIWIHINPTSKDLKSSIKKKPSSRPPSIKTLLLIEISSRIHHRLASSNHLVERGLEQDRSYSSGHDNNEYEDSDSDSDSESANNESTQSLPAGTSESTETPTTFQIPAPESVRKALRNEQIDYTHPLTQRYLGLQIQGWAKHSHSFDIVRADGTGGKRRIT
jgi:hypothetical protein